MTVESHPTIGATWVAITALMALVLWLRSEGLHPLSLYGMACGALATWATNTIAGPDNDPLQFKPEQFMYVLLPPIVLNSGLSFKWRESQGTFGTSLVLAWFGTVGTALWISLGLWGVENVEPWIVAFWIGSILSPTDPVGTLAQMKQLGDHPIRLVLEHESLLNDAVAVMLVHTSERAWNLQVTMTKSETMEVIAVTVGMTCLASLIGAAMAWFMTARLHENAVFCLVSGMFVFALCETIGASGIIGLFVYGAVFNHRVTHPETQTVVKFLADFSETYVYITMGGVVVMTSFEYASMGVTAIVACYVGRIINVFFFSGVVRIGGVRWNLKQTIFMSVCGMRGAVSLALAVSAPASLRPMMVTITVMEVIFSMISTSIGVKWCLRYLLDERS